MSSCKEDIEIKDIIEVSTEFIEVDGEIVLIKSKINLESNQITEHGHCWTNDLEIPMRIAFSPFSCLGPLSNKKDFTDEIEPGVGVFYIRAYVIVNDYIIYGQHKVIAIQAIK